MMGILSAIAALVQLAFAVYFIKAKPFREAWLFAAAMLTAALANGSAMILTLVESGAPLFKGAAFIFLFSLALVVPISLYAAFTFLQRIGVAAWPARAMGGVAALVFVFVFWAWNAGVGKTLLDAQRVTVVLDTVNRLFEIGREAVPVPLPTFGQVVLALAALTAYPILAGFRNWYRGRGNPVDRNSAAYLLLSILFMGLIALPAQVWFRTAELILLDAMLFTIAIAFLLFERQSERVHHFLARLPMGQKLGLGFGSIVAVVGALSLVGVMVFSFVNQQVQSTITTQHFILTYSQDFLSNVRAARGAEYEALVLNRQSLSSVVVGPLDRLQRHVWQAEQKLKALEAQPLSPQERKQVEVLNATLNDYKESLERFSAYLLEIGDQTTGLWGKWERANERLEDLLRSTAVEQETVGRFFELQEAEREFVITHRADHYRKARLRQLRLQGWFESVDASRLSPEVAETIRQAIKDEQEAFEAYASAVQGLDLVSRQLEANGVTLQLLASRLYEQATSEFEAALAQTLVVQSNGGLVVIGMTGLAFLMALFALQVISTHLTGEALTLAKTAEEFAAGNLDARVQLHASDELGLVGRTFNQMAAQLQNLLSTLEERVARRTSQLEAAALVSQEASMLADIEQLLNHTVELIRQRFGFYHAQIFLLDEERKWATLKASTGEPGRLLLARGHRLEVGSRSVIGKVTAEGVPVVARDTDTDPVHRKNELLPETRSELAVPMKLGDEVIGALDVQSKEPDAFGDDDIVALQILANQIAITLRNAELFRSLQDVLYVVDSLYTTSQWLVEAESEEEVLTTSLGGLVEIGERVLDLTCAFSVLFTGDENLTDARIVTEWCRTGCPSDVSLTNGILHLDNVNPEVFNEWYLLAEPEDEVIADFWLEGDGRKLPLREYLKKVNAASVTFLFLRVEEEVIGAIILASARSYAFDPEYLASFRTLVEQAGTVLHNRRLFARTEEALRQTRLLYNAASGFAQAESPQEVATVALQVARDLGFDAVHLAVLPGALPAEVDALLDREFRVYAYAIHPDLHDVEYAFRLTAETRHLAELLLANRETVFAVESGGKFALNALVNDLDREIVFESLLSRPLMTRDQISGILIFASLKPRQFDEATKQLFTAVCEQAGVALETILLLNQLKANLEHTQALYETSSALMAASTVDDMAQALAIHLLPHREVFVAINELDVDENGNMRGFTVLANYLPGGRRSPHVGRYFTVEEFPSIQKLLEPGFPPLIVEDVELSPHLSDADKASYRRQRVRSVFAVAFPIGEGYGMLHISFRTPTHFTEADIQRWQTIVSQLSLVMNNRRLLEETRAALEETQQLYETASALVSSTNAEDVYAVLLEACEALEPYRAGILTFDAPVPLDKHPETVRLARAGGKAAWPFPDGTQLSAEQLPLVVHLPSNRPFLAPQVNEDLLARPGMKGFLRSLDAQALAFYPFHTGTSWLGGLLLLWQEPQAFKRDDVRTLEAAVPQATVILENLRLFQNVQEALDRTARLYRASRQLSAATNVQDIANALYEVVADLWDTVAVLLFPEPVEADQEVPDQVINAAVAPLSKQIVPTGVLVPWRGIIPDKDLQERMLTEVVSVSGDATAKEMEKRIQRNLLKRMKVGRFLTAPLRTSSRFLGWLSLRSAEPGPIPAEEVETFRTFADQAAIVLENLQLFEAVQRRAWRDEMLSRITAQLYRETNPQFVLQIGAERLREALRARRTWVWTAWPRHHAAEGIRSRTDGEDFSLLPDDGKGDGNGRQ